MENTGILLHPVRLELTAGPKLVRLRVLFCIFASISISCVWRVLVLAFVLSYTSVLLSSVIQPHGFSRRMNEFDLDREGMSIGSVDLCRTIDVVVALY